MSEYQLIYEEIVEAMCDRIINCGAISWSEAADELASRIEFALSEKRGRELADFFCNSAERRMDGKATVVRISS